MADQQLWTDPWTPTCDPSELPGSAAAYPHTMDLRTALTLSDAAWMSTDNALAAAEAVLLEAWQQAFEEASAAAGKRGVKALREKANSLMPRHAIVGRRRQFRGTSPDCRDEWREGMELTPAGYRALEAMWRSARTSGAKIDETAMRAVAAAVAAPPA
ncbi:hypothetical protein [Geodermatophilus sabuli]|uniref:Uncharacterized protein n=1 Tax=Geodermatophilus sabuli TaxID=1564158 RepID=A0A285EBL9_9ACTN|nr:hypothetical protein [Geodermatophilus sabuli]MBB3084206.1 hypothetical protein [Geodermatophilus sabuli]SNX96522.1 hypothetical protein SAMN06893097_104237 [Geodermatophilus sabuli]